MTSPGGAGLGRASSGDALLESIRAAAHAAVDAGDGAAAVELTRLLEQRRPTPAPVASLDAARRRRRAADK
jgi:hypothetical protein